MRMFELGHLSLSFDCTEYGGCDVKIKYTTALKVLSKEKIGQLWRWYMTYVRHGIPW